MSIRLYRVRRQLYDVLSNRRVMIALTIIPALVVISFTLFVPIIWAIRASFYEIPVFALTETWAGLENYILVLQDGAFWESVWKGIIFAGGSVAIQLVLGTALGVVISKSFKFVTFVRAIVMLPYLIPTAVIGFIALWMGNAQWGIINSLLNSSTAWYGNPDIAMIAVILTNSWKFTIFVTIMVLARLQSIPEGFYEAAEVAGANAYQKFRDITLPHLRSVILIVLLLRGVWMFNKFDIIWILTRGGPGDATRTNSIYAYETAFTSGNLGQGAAVSVILFVFLSIAAIAYFHFLQPAKEVRVE